MEVNYKNTYWNHKGKHETLKDELQPLIPVAGAVPNAENNPALETFRIASNCYYDLYNNGLCNRGQEFAEVFDISGLTGDHTELTQELIDHTESKMDEIILAAYAEQFPTKLPTGLSAYPLPGSINNPQPATLGDGTFLSVDGPPVRCPYCGGTDITELDQWAAVSSEEAENTVTLVEWQCVNACGGRAFWV